MNELHEQLAQHTAQVRCRMNEACRAAGRDPASVQLCAASKTQTSDTVRAAWNIGIDVFGENRVQELDGKRPPGLTAPPRCISSATCKPTRCVRWWARRI